MGFSFLSPVSCGCVGDMLQGVTSSRVWSPIHMMVSHLIFTARQLHKWFTHMVVVMQVVFVVVMVVSGGHGGDGNDCGSCGGNGGCCGDGGIDGDDGGDCGGDSGCGGWVVVMVVGVGVMVIGVLVVVTNQLESHRCHSHLTSHTTSSFSHVTSLSHLQVLNY